MPTNSAGLIAIVVDVVGEATHEFSTQDTAAHVSDIPSGGTLLKLPGSPPSDGDSYEFADIDGSCGPASPLQITDPNGHPIAGASTQSFTTGFVSGFVRFNARARTWALLSSEATGGGGGSTTKLVNGGNLAVDILTGTFPVPAGTDVTIYSMAVDSIPLDIAPGDTFVMVAQVLFVSQNNAWIGRFTKIMTLHDRGGIVQTPNTGTTDEDVTPATSDNISAQLVGTTADIELSGVSPNQTLIVSVGAHAGVPLYASALVTFVKMPFPVPLPPPPTLTALSVTHGPTVGGTATEATGTNLDNAFASSLNGSPTTSTTPVDGDHANLLSGPGSPGTGDAVISTPGGDATLPNAWTYDTPTTPLTIFGAPNLFGWVPNTQIQHAGPDVTGLNNLGSGGNFTLSGSGAAPAYVASSTSITPNGPSSLHDGTSQFFLQANFVQGAAINGPAFFWAVVRLTDVHGWISFFQTTVGISIGSVAGGNADMEPLSGGGPINSGATITNDLCIVMGYTDGFSGPGSNGWVAVNRGARVTRTGSSSGNLASPGRMVIMGDLVLPTGELFDWGFVGNIEPDTTMQSELVGYAETTYNGGAPFSP